MKLLLDDKSTRGYDLNANEACIFAAILKCTRAGRGWYGNYRELAAAMPFVMSYKTANRAVQKLLTLGLIVERDNALFTNNQSPITNGQIVPNDGQIVHENGQIVQESGQNVLPPNNPPIINNNMNEKEKEQQRALCARDCDEQQDCLFLEEDFNAFWIGFNPKPEFANRKKATWEIWKTKTPVARKKILEAVLSGTLSLGEGGGRGFNPFFFVQDFPEPQPEWKTGGETGEDLVQVRYNGRYKICTRATMELFGLEWDRDW